MKVKICGITRYEDAEAATQLGAAMLGLNFYPPSPRALSVADAAQMVGRLRATFGVECPLLVGVFVNADVSHITEILDEADLDFAQLSGDESDEVIAALGGRAFKALRPPSKVLALDDVRYYAPQFPTDARVPSVVLDAYHPKLYGGTGETANIDVALAVKAAVPRLMLAGGLSPSNVGERVAAVQPWGVDVASGVEPDGLAGVKDHEKMRQFIVEAHAAAQAE